MTKAVFSERQEAVKVFALTHTLIQYQLCVHEEIIQPEEEGQEVAYQYDFHEFTETTSYLQPEDVFADPEAYIDYVPKGGDIHEDDKPVPSVREEIAELKERQQITEDAIIELAEIIGGGE